MYRFLVVVVLTLLVVACSGKEQTGKKKSPGTQTTKTPASEDNGPAIGPPHVTPSQPASGGAGTPSAKAAVEAPSANPDDAVFSRARELIGSGDPQDREQAVEVLLKAKNHARAGFLVSKLLFDKDEDVRTVAAEELPSLKYDGLAADLRKCLENDQSPDVRKQALVSLYKVAGEGMLPDAVRTMQNDAESRVRASAANLVGRILASGKVGAGPKDNAIDALIKDAANDFDNSVLLAVITALRKARSVKSVPVLIESLKSSSTAVRTESAKALGEIGDKKAAGPLVDRLTPDEDPQVRTAAAEALGHVGNQSSVAPLIALLTPKEDIGVVTAAVGSLKILTKVEDKALDMPPGPTAKQEKAVLDAWAAWWKEHKSDYPAR